ncbi:hypothetical protein [Halalkalibacter urbisdiaboli]|uniref:hypothetical protein n=1 Tax=Halalkalibacter urbisdiaboli TaxID=1960589 RepID=UPI000B4366BF|nr:hypothetical protein [Halalkalibacter urbisdiaboli]
MELTGSHWIYLIGTCVIIVTMLCRQNVVVPAILMTFFVGWLYSGSFVFGLQTIFQASLTAAAELFNIFLIIAIMTALLHSLKEIGTDEQMIAPFQKVMKNGHLSYWLLAIVTFLISLFFWPTPAVPLVGAILIPVAIKAGLPPVGAGVAIALAGQGMALSSDYVIKIAPMLTATSANISVGEVADRALLLSLVTGTVAISLAYFMIRKLIKYPSQKHLTAWEDLGEDEDELIDKEKQRLTRNTRHSKLFAVLVPLSFLTIVVYMVLAQFSASITTLEGGTGAALIGGTAVLLLIAASSVYQFKKTFSNVSNHLVKGFLFAFRAMGPVIPIAGFFFIGSEELSAKVFSVENPENAPSFLFDLVQAGQQIIPESAFLAAFGILIIGMVTGLDGSGFSGLPLVGSLAGALSETVGVDAATLAAIGQMGSIWVGGGTLIAWSSLVAVAGFAKVPVMDLVRKCFLPVILGLVIATCFALLFL